MSLGAEIYYDTPTVKTNCKMIDVLFNRLRNIELQLTPIKEEVKMEWKDLNKDTPLDVLINKDKYQIQLKSSNEGWRDTEIEDEVQLFEKINNGFMLYRYRLKPLEPIRITNEVLKDLNSTVVPSRMGIEEYYGRPVEIID